MSTSKVDAQIEALREKWESAVEREKHADAIKALIELEKLDTLEPRWAHRLGEEYRRGGKAKEAEDAFARAAEHYFQRGFLPRAIAMAKLVSSLNPARGDVLSKLAPPLDGPSSAVNPLAATTMSAAFVMPQNLPVKAPPTTVEVPARAPAAPPAQDPRTATGRLRAAAIQAKPVVLQRAADAGHDEVRFADSGNADVPSIDFALEDVSGNAIEIVVDEAAATEPTIDRLAAMAGFRLFASLSRDALLELADIAELAEFRTGQNVVLRDEAADSLYAIVGGTAAVTVAGSPKIRLQEGDVFGEGCLLDEGRRQADVRAETDLMTLRIAKEALDGATARHEEISEALFQLLARRLVMNLMHTSPLFVMFEPTVRLELSRMFEVRRAEPGTILAERGRKSDGLYIVLAGNISAESKQGATARVARGSAFGHGSLLGASPARETVWATTEAVLLRLPAKRFSSLAAMYPPVLAHLADTAEVPLRESLRPRSS